MLRTDGTISKEELLNIVKSMPDDTLFKLDTVYRETYSKYIQNLVIKTDYVVGSLDVIRM